MAAAIELVEVSKKFRLHHERVTSLKERVVRLRRTRTAEDFWALRDVSLAVQAGETVGLIGQNGSGKSTLLKCVAGILRPTSGVIRRHGRTAALLELGAGFHGDLTGRENVYLNASILGFSRREIDAIFDEIVAFAEIEPFIDNQVKHYSSGMAARLGFAVAVNVQPEILLVDEVLAVGDEAFQRKCLERIRRFQAEGRTILLVTHSADLVRQICHRAAVLDGGRLVADGPPGEAILAFREALRRRGDAVPGDVDAPILRRTLRVRITGVEIVYPEPTRAWALPGEPVEVRVSWAAPEPVDEAVFSIALHDQRGVLLVGTNSELIGAPPGRLAGTGTYVFRFERFEVLDGVYRVSLGIHSHDGAVIYDQRGEQDVIEVMHPGQEVGLVRFDVRGRVEAAAAAGG